MPQLVQFILLLHIVTAIMLLAGFGGLCWLLLAPRLERAAGRFVLA
jgi:hypothetical protein